MDLRTAAIALLLLMGCGLDSRRLDPGDAGVAGMDAGDESGTAGTMAAIDTGIPDAPIDGPPPDAPAPPECTEDEGCPDQVDRCRVGRCGPEGRCTLEPAPDCDRCGPGSLCVNGGCYPGGVFFSDALDSEELPEAFTTSVQRRWTMTDGTSPAGGRSAVSAPIGDRDVSTLWLTLPWVPEESRISFWRWVYSEQNYDRLEFAIGVPGRDVDAFVEWSGNEPWDEQEFEISGFGEITFRWSYVKNDSFSIGEDQAGIDQVSVWLECP